MSTSKSSRTLNAQRLKSIRETLNYSQRELAREFGVTAAAISMWESGMRQVPGTVLRLMEVYEESLPSYAPSAPSQAEIGALSDEITRTIFELPKSRGGRASLLRKTFESALRSYLQGEVSRDPVKKRVQLALARRLAATLAGRRGLPMKAAQLVSYIDPTIPREIRETFVELQNMGRPMSAGAAARVVYEELGKAPHKIFAEWNPRPFAAASIGQVHRARLHSGERVAVKVQYPGIQAQLQNHLKTFNFVNTILSILNGQRSECLEEVRRKIIEECDYRNEASYQERFHKAFAGDPHILIPRVYGELSSKRVITMEFADGLSLKEFAVTASQDARNLAGFTLTRFHTEAIFEHDLAHGDPHPGNYLFNEEKIVFLDFGRIAHYEVKARDLSKKLYVAAIEDKPEEGRRAMQELGMVRDWDTFDFEEFWEFMVAQQEHFRAKGAFRFTPEYVKGLVRAAKELPGRKNLYMHRDFFWGNLVNLSLWSILADLGAEAEWRKVVPAN